MAEQDTRQNTELKKSVVQSVLLCVTSFHVYFDKQVHKKKMEKHFNFNLKINFAESNAQQKQMRAAALRHRFFFFFFFFSLIWVVK